MSSYTIKAKNKETGKVDSIWCLDDYFGRHKYGYSALGDTRMSSGPMLTEEQFENMYEMVE